jgi:hypothetical protein
MKVLNDICRGSLADLLTLMEVHRKKRMQGNDGSRSDVAAASPFEALASSPAVDHGQFLQINRQRDGSHPSTLKN